MPPGVPGGATGDGGGARGCGCSGGCAGGALGEIIGKAGGGPGGGSSGAGDAGGGGLGSGGGGVRGPVSCSFWYVSSVSLAPAVSRPTAVASRDSAVSSGCSPLKKSTSRSMRWTAEIVASSESAVLTAMTMHGRCAMHAAARSMGGARCMPAARSMGGAMPAARSMPHDVELWSRCKIDLRKTSGYFCM